MILLLPFVLAIIYSVCSRTLRIVPLFLKYSNGRNTDTSFGAGYSFNNVSFIKEMTNGLFG